MGSNSRNVFATFPNVTIFRNTDSSAFHIRPGTPRCLGADTLFRHLAFMRQEFFKRRHNHRFYRQPKSLMLNRRFFGAGAYDGGLSVMQLRRRSAAPFRQAGKTTVTAGVIPAS